MRAVLVAVVLGATLLSVAPAGAQTLTSKVYNLDVSHPEKSCSDGTTSTHAVTPGSIATATIMITNVSKDEQKFGSANVIVPPEFTELRLLTHQDGITLDGHTLKIRNVQVIRPNHVAAELEFRAPQVEADFLWDAVVRQSETFAENENNWTRVSGDNARRTTTDAKCSAVTACAAGAECQITLRHSVPCVYLGGCDSAEQGLAAADATTIHPDYYVETTVTALAGTNAGELQLFYEVDQSNVNNFSDPEAGCFDYTEPSDIPARFQAPPGRDLEVEYTVSADLWGVTGNARPESCFSAEYFFVGRYDQEEKFTFEDQTWTNAFLLDCVPGDLAPCVRSRTTDAAGNVTVEDSIPAPNVLIGGIDPMRN